MTTRTLTLAEFITQRIDEDEQVATAAGHGCGYLHKHNAGWIEVDLPAEHNARPSYEMRFIRTIDPARVLAQCAALRAVVELHRDLERAVHEPAADDADDEGFVLREGGECAECHHNTAPCETLRNLARVYKDHPDFDPAWS